MKIQVGLLDESEIIKKMLSHCLHHFVVNIHAFKNWDQCLLHANNENLSILFVDWDMSHGSTRLIDLAREQLNSVPTVLMHRQEASTELSKRAPNFNPHRIKKPINPNQVREIFSKLVPQITESSIHSFLRFPKSSPSDSSQIKSKQTPATQTLSIPITPNQITPIQTSPNPTTPKQMTPSETKSTVTLNPQEKLSFQTSPGKRTQAPFPPPSRDAKTQEQIPSFSKETQTQETPKKKFLHQTSTNTQKSDLSASTKPSPSQTKKFDKSQIVLNEDTKNDLAPMAIKSSDSKKTASPSSLKLTEEQILEILKKYKDSLEFTKLMEKVLSDYAKEALLSLLEPNQTKSTIKESMQDFQEGEKFKKQVNEEIHSQIKTYLKEELPLKMKSIIQEEIKKILSN